MVLAKDTSARRVGPDPVVGIGLVIFGVLIMGISGAATWHYVFNAGTGMAILGAVWFVVAVTLSSLGQKRLGSGDDAGPVGGD